MVLTQVQAGLLLLKALLGINIFETHLCILCKNAKSRVTLISINLQ